MPLNWPLNCCECGRFIGKDGYPDVYYDTWSGGYEEGYSYCGPCGRKLGYSDKRKPPIPWSHENGQEVKG